MIQSLCMVDDNVIDVYQLNRVIKKSCLVEHFYSFCDGQEALEHYLDYEESQKKFNGQFPPDVILLDINMPRMDGFEFLEKFSELPAEKKNGLIILMLTSSGQDRDKKRAAHFDTVKGYILKPFTPEHLQKIAKMIENGLHTFTVDILTL